MKVLNSFTQSHKTKTQVQIGLKIHINLIMFATTAYCLNEQLHILLH